MNIRMNLSALRQTKWHEYATRFLLGGTITAAAGIIAKNFGPVAGGLFLAFPAIFPASATLVEQDENRNKEQSRIHDRHRGEDAAARDAAGAAMGSIGLIAFAIAVSLLLTRFSTARVLGGSAILWLAVSVGVWMAAERYQRKRS